MRTAIIFLITFIFNNNIYGQEIVENETEEILPVGVVNEAPIFPSCINRTGKNLRNCFFEQLRIRISENLEYPIEHTMDSITPKIFVAFKIDKKGRVFDIKIRKRSGMELFEKEAIRVIENMPKLKPAINKGEKVIVQCHFPINFSLN